MINKYWDYLTQHPLWILAIVLGLLIGISIIVLLLIRRARRKSPPKVQKQVAVNAPVTSTAAAPLQASGLQLIDEAGHSIPVTSLPALIGRAAQNDIVLDNNTISHTHARIYYEAALGSVCIVDCHSQNGILVNGHPTGKNVLMDGDTITLGNFLFTFRNAGYHPPVAQ